MAIRILRENAGSRTPGLSLDTGVNVVGGLVVVLKDNNTIKLYTNASTDQAYGLVLDSNIPFPAQATKPEQTAGQGFDYLDYNRQGLVSVINDAEVEVYDDGRSATVVPINTGGSYSVNKPVYAAATTGVITDVDGGGTNQRIGRITSVTGSGATLVLGIRLEI